MAYVQHQPIQLSIRQPQHKEPEWRSLCDNVFDEYLNDDDLFGLGNSQTRERSSSDDSGNLFDFSGSSEQSYQTAGTSPLPAWEHVGLHTPIIEAQQPKAQESVDFWQKTLRALEQNAAESEKKQHTLRASKSHPDFLSLGGCPSPPAIPSLPTDQHALSVSRRRVSRHAANGRAPSTSAARSVSRGRPTGVTKGGAPSNATNPYATVRKASTSPHKMMTPSRYRAGFEDVWADRVVSSPKKYQLRVHSSYNGLPASPPPSAKAFQDDFAASESPTGFAHVPLPMPLTAYEDHELSPLTTTFQQQARIHTPLASPSLGHAAGSYLGGVPSLPPNPYAPQTVPLNDASPIFPERTSLLVPNRIGSFDFGFTSSCEANTEAWNTNAVAFVDPIATSIHYSTDDPFATANDPFAGLHHAVLSTTESHEPLSPMGVLGISCDPALISPYATTSMAAIAPMTAPIYHNPYHAASQPTTPHHHRRSAPDQRSPSPSPLRNPRQRSTSRRPSSKHRRAKSAASTVPLLPANADKTGFVNFTPSDHNKILSGVAPSGSSKTKARREKEALDKRRRLSLAAVKAVVDAGGDLDGLTRAGLLA